MDGKGPPPNDPAAQDSQPKPPTARALKNSTIPAVNYWGPDGIFKDLSRTYLNDLNLKSEYLREFWKMQKRLVSETPLPRHQPLPPKRIRRIIKCDEDVIVRKCQSTILF